jgi:oxygen-independent coproporphyrinogen-3 oxidase
MNTYAVYIHIPFCLHRCAYCDFNTYAGQNKLIPDYVDAIQNEIKSSRNSASVNYQIQTIYFGGGTPSLLPVDSVVKILDTLKECFEIYPDIEISLEANPGTLSLSYLQELRKAGVNRLSLGMQSAHHQDLIFLERSHNFDDVIHSIYWSRQAGFENISLDLIFGLPGQTIEAWDGSLFHALNLSPKHLSLYALTIEEGTPLYRWASRGLVSLPDPDLAADMYDLASDKLAAAGYEQYEISNWARENDKFDPGKGMLLERIDQPNSAVTTLKKEMQWACQHNLQYWRNKSYLGFGAGAHGYVGGFRTSNVLTPTAYIHKMGQSDSHLIHPRTPATITCQPIDQMTEMKETMMMGLRLTQEGVSRDEFKLRFKQDMYEVFGLEIERLLDTGLVRWSGKNKEILRLTTKGRLLGNRVFQEFV